MLYWMRELSRFVSLTSTNEIAMKQSVKRDITSVIISWLTIRATESATVLTVICGYLLGVLGARQLTITNFLIFTATNAACGVLLWMLNSEKPLPSWQRALYLTLISLLTFGGGLLALIGLAFNWLLYFVAVANYFRHLSIRIAAICSVFLYMAVVLNSLILGDLSPRAISWITLLAGFCFVAAFSLSNRFLNLERERSNELLSQLKTSRQDLESAHVQLQKYAQEVEELAIARERTRLARDIHDTLGHYLTIMTIQLETIRKVLDHDPARAISEVEEARRVVAQCMQEVRNALVALRPASVVPLNLTSALTQLGSEFKIVAPSTEITLDLDTPLPYLSAELQHTLYRATQEALTNARKHAHATKILVRLRYDEEILELIIRDNGPGTTDQSTEHIAMPASGFGLIGLRERIELLGGKLTYGPVEPSGYRVAVRVHVPSGEKSSSHKKVQIQEEMA